MYSQASSYLWNSCIGHTFFVFVEGVLYLQMTHLDTDCLTVQTILRTNLPSYSCGRDSYIYALNATQGHFSQRLILSSLMLLYLFCFIIHL